MLKTGDIAYLKSGSPDLCVTQTSVSQDGEKIVSVEWINAAGVKNIRDFNEIMLTKTKPSL